MNTKQKEKLIHDLLKVLANNNVTFAEVPEVLKSLEKELNELSQQQVIQIP
ncbi:hypothetical protein ACFYKT_16460 [Cytobacillus sp. FJAT-53684]|uniref:Uncharacterized protein n=1 Tax=Cytobacillus mangrovibacter TaxID=3299024 RepID=A0ABW6K4Q0_9BACI